MTQRVRIGSTRISGGPLEIAPVAFGGNVFGWTADRDTSFAMLDGFADAAGAAGGAGGAMIDTADGYSHWVPGNGGGESETILGEWFEARGRRDDVVLATKVSTHPDFFGLAPENIRAALNASLARLKTDRIDLYYAHFDDAETPLEETVAAFSQLVDDGKIRAIGVSNYTADRIAEWFRIAREGGYHLPVALQPHYNLVERKFETNGLRQIAEEEDLAVLTYFSLAKGFLAGKYRDASDEAKPGASPRAGEAAHYLDERGKKLLAVLDEIAAAHRVPVASVSLAWLKAQPTIAAPIASARNAEQLTGLVTALDLELGADEVAALTEAGARHESTQ